jgi:hypothetical protein
MSNCPTCGHARDEHSDLAGCLYSSGSTYCDCQHGPSTILVAKVTQAELEDASARVRASRAQGLTEGRRLRDEGAAAAGSALPGHVEAEWRAKAEKALAELIASREQFDADDLVERVGLPPVPNMVGGVFAGARAAKRIKAVGYTQGTRAASHARVQRVWVAA